MALSGQSDESASEARARRGRRRHSAQGSGDGAAPRASEAASPRRPLLASGPSPGAGPAALASGSPGTWATGVFRAGCGAFPVGGTSMREAVVSGQSPQRAFNFFGGTDGRL